MERSSRVLHHGNPKIWFFFQKSSKFEFWFLTKSWNHLSFVNISPTLVIDTSMERFSRVLHHGNPKIKNFKFEFGLLTKSWNHLSFVNTSPIYIYISNWYVNGKVFTSTTTWEPKNLILFFKKGRNWIWLVFWLVLKSLNQHWSRSQHAPICRHRGCIVVPLTVVN